MSRSTEIESRIRWMMRWLLGALSAGAVVLGVAPAVAAAKSAPTVVQSVLAREAVARPKRVESVIVQFKPGVRMAVAKALFRLAGGHITEVVPIIHGVAGRMQAHEAKLLGRSRWVHAITINERIKGTGTPNPQNLQSALATTYPMDVGAPLAWNYQFQGQGIGVAVIDSGVDGNLPDFQGPNGSRVVASAVVNPGASNASDPFGHGTFVAGIIAGDGYELSPSNPNYGQYVGIAPQANLIAIKAGDDLGDASELDVINGIQFAIAHQSQYNIRVINLSLESTVPQSYLADPLDAAVESAWMHGIVVVAAAGNLGNIPGAEDYAPANDPYVITVGATDDQGSTAPASQTIAAYSSQGVTQDGLSKPDIYAPGSHIISVLAPNSAFTQLCPNCAIGGAYIKASGTSFAAPVVSGTVADMLSADPNLTPDQVKGLVVGAGQPMPSTNGKTVELSIGRMAYAAQQSPGLAAYNADQGLTPNPSASSGSVGAGAAGFVPAPPPLTASWALSSWSCATCTGAAGSVDPTLSSWSFSSWSFSSWS
jgi:serine protease AprX